MASRPPRLLIARSLYPPPSNEIHFAPAAQLPAGWCKRDSLVKCNRVILLLLFLICFLQNSSSFIYYTNVRCVLQRAFFERRNRECSPRTISREDLRACS